MERIVRGRSATLTHTFYVDGVPTNPSPDAATVTITRADGTVLVNAQPATEAGTGVVSYTLTPAQTADLDTLTLTWTASYGGQAQGFEEIVQITGGYLFSVADARRIKPLDSTTAFPTDSIVAMRTTVEDALEQACGVAFVPRYTTETHNGTVIHPRWPYVRKIRGVIADGETYSVLQLADVAFSPLGIVSPSGYWPTSGITIAYEHGMDYPPPEIVRAGLILLKMWLGAQNRPVDDRAITFNTTDGGTYSLAVPGRNGSVFGHPDVDVAVKRYSMLTGVA